MTDRNTLDFSFIIASSVHDMKNSLSMLLHSLDEVNQELSASNLPIAERMATLQYEAARVNNDLVQLLSLYKIKEDILSANIDEHFLADFLEEQTVRYAPLFETRNTACKVDCDLDLAGYFDRDLVGGVINNILANAIRYSKSLIRIHAYEEDGWLVIRIEDDGAGFPPAMIQQPQAFIDGVDFDSGSTHLGLYFAHRIAELHTQGDRKGYIQLSNDSPANGGRFSIWLP